MRTLGSTIAADPRAKFLFAYDTSVRGVDVFSINPTNGGLTLTGDSPFPAGNLEFGNSEFPAALTTDTTGAFLYDADLFGIAGFGVNTATGALTSIASSPFPNTAGPLGIVADPAGKFLYTSNSFGIPTISGFAIDSISGLLTWVPGPEFPIPAAASSLNIAIPPSGKFLYAIVEPASIVEAWAIDGITGTLDSLVPGSPFNVGNGPGALISSLAIDPTGRFLYVSQPTTGGVFGFTIDSTSGALTPMAGSPFLISAGSRLLIDSSGQYMYSLFGPSIIGIKIDGSTGELTPLSESPFPAGPFRILTQPAALAIVKIP